MLKTEPKPSDTPTQSCRFSHAISSRKCSCVHAQRQRKGYETVAGCRDAESGAVCAEWLVLARQASKFVLGQTREPAALPKSEASQLQLGCLQGLGNILDPDHVEKIQDVSALLNRARRRFGGLDRVPMERVVQAIHRTRTSGGKR